MVGAGEGHIADLQQLRRGEEGHVRGIVKERVAEATLVDQQGGKPRALGLDGAGHAGGAGADDEQVVVGVVVGGSSGRHASILLKGPPRAKSILAQM